MGFDYAVKIQALLANAEDERLSDAARAQYAAKAEQLMTKYRIEQEELIATDAVGAKPIRHEMKLPGYSAMSGWHPIILRLVCDHTGVRFTFDYRRDGEYLVMVGYEGDVRYAEFLWTAALLTFSTRVDPRWDENRTREENIFLLRNAGIERRKIADAAGLDGTLAKNRSLVQRIYLRECERRGEPARATGLSHQTDTYRKAYARSFYTTLDRRLRDARDAADAASGGAPVLHGRKERVDEAFYALFPNKRPVVCSVCAEGEGPCEAHRPKPCEACLKAQDGACRRHRWTAADERRWQRDNYSASARAGQASGVAAASDIRLTRTERAARLDDAPATGATLELM